MLNRDRKPDPMSRSNARDPKLVSDNDKKTNKNKTDGTYTTWFRDGSFSHTGVMVGRTNYDENGDEC